MGSTLSVVASVALIRSTFNDFVPEEIRGYLWRFSRRFSSELTMVVKESHEGSNNHLFAAAVTYHGSNALSANLSSAPQRVTVGKNQNLKKLTFGLDRNSEIVDVFNGFPMKWRYNTDYNSTLLFEVKWYELSFNKKHKDMVINKYLPHIIDVAKRIKDENSVVKFYTTKRDRWSSNAISLGHPMTFNTLAMDGNLKREVIDDLEKFVNGKDYYQKIGKVWKRGYLLYGPPGTGKSSLIAAMANYLNYDIYNLNLSAVSSDCTLDYLLLHVSNRSILVVEDIDCSIKLQNREKEAEPESHQQPQLTLSGLLNAIDGLLSCCGDERIIIFTTNFKDRIDPALLRPGRMDMHICLSYCTFSIFKQLAANYLDVYDHSLFSQIEKLIGEVQVTPAEVAGELMTNSEDPTACLEALIRFLERKGSKEQSSTPESDTNLDKKNSVKECSGSSEKEDTSQGRDSLKTHEVKCAAADSNSVQVAEYKIKTELKQLLKAVISKHGDIAANSSLNSVQCRSSLLEIVCSIIYKLQSTDFRNITQVELKIMLTNIRDLASVGLKVGWIHMRLDEILEAKRLYEYCSNLKEDRSRYTQELAETEKELEACKEDESERQEKYVDIQEKLGKLKVATEQITATITKTEAKLSCFYQGSLVDGLI